MKIIKSLVPFAFFIATLFFMSQVSAGELTFKFINPNFGGSPFNGTPLLNNALAQDEFEDPDEQDDESSAEEFADRLDRQILSRLSRRLVDNAFGEEGEIVEGTIETGINTINIEETPESTIVTITNPSTGETTVVEVPFF